MRNEAGEWADPVALIPLYSGYMRVRIVSLNTYSYCPDNQRWLEKYLIYYSSTFSFLCTLSFVIDAQRDRAFIAKVRDARAAIMNPSHRIRQKRTA